MAIKTYAYLLAYGRSGSTLLDWQLDSHPRVHGVGEIGRLPDSLKRNASMPKYCGCGSSLENCVFWKSLLRHGRECGEIGFEFENWNKSLLSHVLMNKPEAEVVLDSSGDLERLRRLLAAEFLKGYKIKVLFLSRDARGVIYSASARGYRGGKIRPTILRATVSWWLRNSQFVTFLKRIPQEQYLHVTYEGLCTEPDKVLNSVHRFLSIEKLGFINKWKSQKHHTFGGNRRLRESTETRLHFDYKWMHELGVAQTFIIDAITGRLNRKLLRNFIL